MEYSQIVTQLDDQIQRLTSARNLLTNHSQPRIYNRNGHTIRKRRPMSPETKQKISAMMKQRWAARKKAARKRAA